MAMLGTRRMTETGEPFEVTAAGDASVRYTVEPVLRYGRTAAGGRLVRASWSSWSYRLKDQPGVEALPVGVNGPNERPDRFLLEFGDDGPDGLEVQLVDR